jgi:hypothetical protein
MGGANGPAALEIDEAPGVEHLSAKEKDMCAMLRLLPKVYLRIKATLVEECRKKGFLHRDAVRQLVRRPFLFFLSSRNGPFFVFDRVLSVFSSIGYYPFFPTEKLKYAHFLYCSVLRCRRM